MQRCLVLHLADIMCLWAVANITIIMHSMELSVSWKAFWNGKMGVCDILSENINFVFNDQQNTDQQI